MCKYFNAHDGNLLKPSTYTAPERKIFFFFFLLLRSTFTRTNVLARKLFSQYRVCFHDFPNYDHYRNTVVQLCEIFYQIMVYNPEY